MLSYTELNMVHGTPSNLAGKIGRCTDTTDYIWYTVISTHSPPSSSNSPFLTPPVPQLALGPLLEH